MLGRRFAVPGYRVAYDALTLEQLHERVGSDVVRLPESAGVLAWDAAARRWLVHAGPRATVAYRLPATLRFLDRRVRPRLPDGSFWSTFCLWDGWREGAPRADDEAPLSPRRPQVLCFAARQGDPEAVLLPEAHYLERFHYARFRWEARLRRDRWSDRAPSAIYCGGAHGRSLVPGGPTVREVLREVVASERLDVRVHLGEQVSRAEQRRYRYLLDVDGFVRTWDAWAWKLLSGSVVLSQASPWHTFFTLDAKPWEHFVPLAEDLTDLGDRLEWCRAHDAECRAIAERGAALAQAMYSIDAVTRRTVEAIAPLVGVG